MFSGERNWCIYTGVLLFSGEGNRRSTVFRRRELPTGALLISGERNWFINVLRRRELGALLISGEGRCSSEFRRREKVLSCFQEKGPGALLFSEERNKCSIVFKRREQVHYSYQEKATDALLFLEKGSGALLFSGEGRWGCTYRFLSVLSI